MRVGWFSHGDFHADSRIQLKPIRQVRSTNRFAMRLYSNRCAMRLYSSSPSREQATGVGNFDRSRSGYVRLVLSQRIFRVAADASSRSFHLDLHTMMTVVYF